MTFACTYLEVSLLILKFCVYLKKDFREIKKV